MHLLRALPHLVISVLLVSQALGIVLPVAEDTSSNVKNAITPVAGKATTLTISDKQEAYLRFHLPAITSGDVASARLRIYFTKVTKPGDLFFSPVNSLWSETDAGSEPTIGPFPMPPISADEVITKRFLVVDVTSIVKLLLDTGLDSIQIASITPLAKMTIGAKEGSGVGYPAELEIDLTADGSIPTGSISSAQLAGAIDPAKLSTGLISTGEFNALDGLTGNIQTQLSGRAPLSHVHGAGDIISGTLSDARLSANVARVNGINTFIEPQFISATTQTTMSLASENASGSWLNLENTSPGGRRFNIISTGQGNSEGTGKLLIRDGTGAGSVRLTLDGDGDLGIGTTNPQGKLEIAVSSTRSIRFKNEGFVSLEAVSTDDADPNYGLLRFRHILEVQPKADGSRPGRVDVRNKSGAQTVILNGGEDSTNGVQAGKVDVRNQAGATTIQLDGESGNLTYRNRPGIEYAQSTASANFAAGTNVISTIAVDAPAAGHILLHAFVDIKPQGPGTDNAFRLLLKDGNTNLVEVLQNFTTGEATVAVSWVVDVASAGAKTFTSSIISSGSNGVNVRARNLTATYLPVRY